MEFERDELLKALTAFFNEEELRTLCFGLGVQYDDLSGEGLEGKSRELIAYSERHGGVVELIDRIVELRPNAYWRDKLARIGAHTHNRTQEIPTAVVRAAAGGRTGPLRDENRLLFTLALSQVNERVDKVERQVSETALSQRTLTVMTGVLLILVVASVVISVIAVVIG